MKVSKKTTERQTATVIGLMIIYNTEDPRLLYELSGFNMTMINFYKVVKKSKGVVDGWKQKNKLSINAHAEADAPVVVNAVVEKLPTKEPKAKSKSKSTGRQMIKGELEKTCAAPVGSPTAVSQNKGLLSVEEFVEARFNSLPDNSYEKILDYRVITEPYYILNTIDQFELNDTVGRMMVNAKAAALTEWLYGLYCIEDDIETEKELSLNGVEVSKKNIKGVCFASFVLDHYKYAKSIKKRYSVDGKLIDRLNIHNEWRKGSGTRKYIAAELDEMKREYPQSLNKSEEDIDALIAKALSEWSYPLEKVRTRGVADETFEHLKIKDYDSDLREILFISELEEVKKMSKDEISKYLSSVNPYMIQIFLVAIASAPRNRAIFNEMSSKFGMDLGQFEMFILKFATRELIEKENDLTMPLIDAIEKQRESIVEYNIEIDNSKLEFVKKYLDATD